MTGDLRKMTLMNWEGGPLPEFGDVLFTGAGSRYIVHSIRPTRGAAPKSVAKLELVKLAPSDDEPNDARRHQIYWCSRGRRK